MDQSSTAEWRTTLERLARSLHTGLDPAEMRDFRQRNLARAMTFAAGSSVFYRHRLAPVIARSGFRFERWNDVPILTKQELLTNRNEILTSGLDPVHGAVRTDWTNGSEGEPLNYARSTLADFVSSKTTQRFMRWWKMDGNQRLAQIQAERQATNVAPTATMRRGGWLEGYPAGELHTYPASIELNQHLAWLQNIRAAYLKTYPEVLGELARLTLRQGRVLRFRLLISGGGVLTEDIRKLCKDAFGCAIADFYGAEEVGSIAAQCPQCGEYHCADENVLTEILADDGRPARPGETGRAVLTTLFNYSFPLIRYQIGDLLEAGDSSTCTRPLQMIRRVRGRTKAIFRLPGGRNIWPYIPADELGQVPNVRRLQFVQVAENAVEFHYVPRDPGQGTDESLLARLVRDFLDPSLQVTAIAVPRIAREESQKYMLYRSQIIA